ncbi:hypothetical protein [Leucobacter komagatae]|uniref:Uncharacterized protein n=1 Tax=Leucobacter komagatae TaxID=55969 RepID=A0A0D0HYD8_9MICO|nr:hypothetical protein [Leucobacter komagatae]KIP52586.1 hypothetical protein SD72_08530 [Leucobacter komagatae]
MRPVTIFACLVPLAGVVVFYLLAASKFVATSPGDLAHARFGWPADWVEQDLSRYAPRTFPFTIDFNWTRSWDAPIATTVSWGHLAMNVLLVATVLTAILFGIVAAVRSARRGRPAPVPTSD